MMITQVMGETDIAFALGQLQRMDPTFNMERFLKEMETYMIPLVTTAYLKPDISLLKLVTEENAARTIMSSLKAREVLGHTWDSRILDLHSVDFAKATVLN